MAFGGYDERTRRYRASDSRKFLESRGYETRDGENFCHRETFKEAWIDEKGDTHYEM